MNEIRYVCGFAFLETDVGKVYIPLVLKKRGPADMAGKLNGVGGKIELGEGIRSAMVREFEEETGMVTSVDEWFTFHKARYSAKHAGIDESKTACVYFMTARLDADRWFARMGHVINDEDICLKSLEEAYPFPPMQNLRYLVPMAHTHAFHPECRTIEG